MHWYVSETICYGFKGLPLYFELIFKFADLWCVLLFVCGLSLRVRFASG